MPQTKLENIELYFTRQGATVIRVDPRASLMDQVGAVDTASSENVDAPIVLVVENYGDLAGHDLERSLTFACEIARFQSTMARRATPAQVMPLYAT